jgi:hypothetical protein
MCFILAAQDMAVYAIAAAAASDAVGGSAAETLGVAEAAAPVVMPPWDSWENECSKAAKFLSHAILHRCMCPHVRAASACKFAKHLSYALHHIAYILRV